jgi:XTP/dITP diphosphohydrolase
MTKAKEIIVVTSNPQKALEINQALEKFGITAVRYNADLIEIQGLRIEDIIKYKVEQAYALVKKPVIVDDTGIFFAGFNHFPGAYCRYMFMALGFNGLFKLITLGQKAYFSSFIAYKASANSPVKLFNGKCHGTLITELRGQRKAKMPYDNIFIPKGDTRTFSQMSVADKQQYDHRSKAVRKLAHYLAKDNS